MEGRGGSDESKTKKRKRNECGLCSLPDEVAMICMAQVSRLDIAALAIASKSHRSLAKSLELRSLRLNLPVNTDSSFYVCLLIYPERNPRWFFFHPIQRLLKPVHWKNFQTPDESSSFVTVDYLGIYVIGGRHARGGGVPTPFVYLLNCFDHTWQRVASMNIPRVSPTACLLKDKIYVFGGCVEGASSSSSYYWGEVYDIRTNTWEFLDMCNNTIPPDTIRGSAMRNCTEFYLVDKHDHISILSYSPNHNQCEFLTAQFEIDANQGAYKDDWFFVDRILFSRAANPGRIVWCLHYEFEWKEVKGLEELSNYDIIKLSRNYRGDLLVFWTVSTFELWCAEISLKPNDGGSLDQLFGKIEWSGVVFKSDSHLFDDRDPHAVKVLYATSIHV